MQGTLLVFLFCLALFLFTFFQYTEEVIKFTNYDNSLVYQHGPWASFIMTNDLESSSRLFLINEIP